MSRGIKGSTPPKPTVTCRGCQVLFQPNSHAPSVWPTVQFCSVLCARTHHNTSAKGRQAISAYRRSHPLPLEVYARAGNTRRGRHPSLETRTKISVGRKRYLSDPAELALHAARIKQACNQPEYLATIRGANNRNWNPDRDAIRMRRRLKFLMYGMLKRILRRRCERKTNHTEILLGYTGHDLRLHLERLFLPEMSWDNYGRTGWVVDHIVPISAFPLDANPVEVNALSNLQPLWWTDNARKSGVRQRHLEYSRRVLG